MEQKSLLGLTQLNSQVKAQDSISLIIKLMKRLQRVLPVPIFFSSDIKLGIKRHIYLGRLNNSLDCGFLAEELKTFTKRGYYVKKD